MSIANDYILGNEALHDRFLFTTEILGAIVSSAPSSLTLLQLENGIGRPAREVAKACANLARAHLLRPDPEREQGWMLACDPASVTLEDVFLCVLEQPPARGRRPASATGDAVRIRHDVDLLLMQATMAINQSVFQHLRQFPLDRLKVANAGVYAAHAQAVNAEQYHQPDDATTR